jgi:hypothetical protein
LKGSWKVLKQDAAIAAALLVNFIATPFTQG